MKLLVKAFNDKRDVRDFINSSGLTKDDILSFFQESDKTYTLMYYAKD